MSIFVGLWSATNNVYVKKISLFISRNDYVYKFKRYRLRNENDKTYSYAA